MTDWPSLGKKGPALPEPAESKGGAHRLFGSLRDALLAAGRDNPDRLIAPMTGSHDPASASTSRYVSPDAIVQADNKERPASMAADANEAGREGRAHKAQPGQPAAHAAAPVQAPLPMTGRVPVDPAAIPIPAASVPVPRTQPAARGPATRFPAGAAGGVGSGDARTQFLRGRQKVSRAKFHQDPVVGWLVIVGGPGLGAHRSIYEGNNTIGRAASQRIPIDFDDDTISGEEQAYIRYDSHDRSFLFVPNLAKTNVVQVNDKKPTGAVALQAMDVITMGRTQLVFVPFCGAEFDWAELSDARG